MKLTRGETYRVWSTSKPSPVQGQRVRLVLTELHVEHKPDKFGFLHNLTGVIISGSHDSVAIDLPPCKLKPLPRRVCRCEAYSFPHAPGLGSCKDSQREQEAPPEGLDLDALFGGGSND